MARSNCTCDGICQCAILAGDGLEVTGSGNAADPYRIGLSGAGSELQAADTATVDLTLTGTGTPDDPRILSADATVAVGDLTDVEDGTDDPGDVLTWTGSHYERRPPATSPPGAVTTGRGLDGDGSSIDPLEVRTSGVWGTPPLDDYGSDSTVGQPVYFDSAGNLRAEPKRDVAPDSERVGGYELVVSETDPGNPATDRIWIQPV